MWGDKNTVSNYRPVGYKAGCRSWPVGRRRTERGLGGTTATGIPVDLDDDSSINTPSTSTDGGNGIFN